jgi:hypothetical protein
MANDTTGAEGFYVTVQRQAAGGRVRTGWLLGPYDTKLEAEARVDAGRRLAYEADPRTEWDAFGVTRLVMKPGAELPAGKLNSRHAAGQAAAS